MKLAKAFLQLIRWPNLVFIALTQCLFYFCVFDSFLTTPGYIHRHLLFYLLMMASVFIAAAGYIINDYFDLHIDEINKPKKVIVDRVIKRRWAIVWHFILSAAGLVISLLISYKTGSWIIIIVNIFCVLLLWFYSTTFKKKLLSGNIIIAALTAWVIIVVYFFAGASLGIWQHNATAFNDRRFFKFCMLYACFAFIVSLIREVVKDLEDMDGDAKYNCKTMPIIWGVPASKVFTAVWLIVCIGALVIVQLYAWQSGWWYIALYIIVFIVAPMLFILKKLHQAIVPSDYHKLSSMIKFVMLAGILSMIFFTFLG
ncbi:MAG: geranylgeranylglycerol-phosphate geranylgeranyltransferase [Ferruginibacter sp.]